jgi:hypothetical protein
MGRLGGPAPTSRRERSRPRDQEPAGRRETTHGSAASPHGPKMRAGTPALPGGVLPTQFMERSRPRDQEPAGRRETTHGAAASPHGPKMRAGTPALPGGVLPIQSMERSRPRDQEPAGRRETTHGSAASPHGPKTRAGTPALPGGVLPIPSLAPTPRPATSHWHVCDIQGSRLKPERQTKTPPAQESVRSPGFSLLFGPPGTRSWGASE